MQLAGMLTDVKGSEMCAPDYLEVRSVCLGRLGDVQQYQQYQRWRAVHDVVHHESGGRIEKVHHRLWLRDCECVHYERCFDSGAGVLYGDRFSKR